MNTAITPVRVPRSTALVVSALVVRRPSSLTASMARVQDLIEEELLPHRPVSTAMTERSLQELRATHD